MLPPKLIKASVNAIDFFFVNKKIHILSDAFKKLILQRMNQIVNCTFQECRLDKIKKKNVYPVNA